MSSKKSLRTTISLFVNIFLSSRRTVPQGIDLVALNENRINMYRATAGMFHYRVHRVYWIDERAIQLSSKRIKFRYAGFLNGLTSRGVQHPCRPVSTKVAQSLRLEHQTMLGIVFESIFRSRSVEHAI